MAAASLMPMPGDANHVVAEPEADDNARLFAWGKVSQRVFDTLLSCHRLISPHASKRLPMWILTFFVTAQRRPCYNGEHRPAPSSFLAIAFASAFFGGSKKAR